MKIALCVPRLTEKSPQNFETIKEFIHKCSENDVDFVIFPESSLTGFNLSDVPDEDLNLGIEIPNHPYISELKLLAKKYSLNISIGVFERDKYSLYDSAIFINRNGDILNKYRRVHSGWRDTSVNEVYKDGTEINTFDCDLGKCLFLICGDCFQGEIQQKVRDLNPDFIFLPIARGFSPTSFDHERWIKEEQEDYLNMVKKLGSITFMVNYIDSHYFGGAFIISKEGKILAEKKLNEEGLLIYKI